MIEMILMNPPKAPLLRPYAVAEAKRPDPEGLFSGWMISVGHPHGSVPAAPEHPGPRVLRSSEIHQLRALIHAQPDASSKDPAPDWSWHLWWVTLGLRYLKQKVGSMSDWYGTYSTAHCLLVFYWCWNWYKICSWCRSRNWCRNWSFHCRCGCGRNRCRNRAGSRTSSCWRVRSRGCTSWCLRHANMHINDGFHHVVIIVIVFQFHGIDRRWSIAIGRVLPTLPTMDSVNKTSPDMITGLKR